MATHQYYFPNEYNKIHGPIKSIQENESQFNPKIVWTIVSFFAIVAFGTYMSLRPPSPEKTQRAEKTEKMEKIEETQKVEVTKQEDPTETMAITTLEDRDHSEVSSQVARDERDEKEVEQEQPPLSEQPAPTLSSREALERAVESINFRAIGSAPLYWIADVDHTDLKNQFIPSEFQSSDAELQNIFIRASDGESWLTYKIDDQPIRRVILRQDRFIFLQGALIKIFIGNVNALKIFKNNQLLEAPSRSGVKSVIFPDEQKENFVLPLFIFPETGETISSREYLETLNN